MLDTPIKPMLLQPSINIPNGENYIHQVKWDGHRATLHYNNGKVKLFTRHGNDISFKYPELCNIILPVENCILDGEVIAFDQSASPPTPCFDNLIVRFQASKKDKIAQLQQTIPVHFSAFDILYLNDRELTKLNLSQRLDILEATITNNEFISYSASYSDGEELFKKMVELGMEGIVSKNLNKPYYIDSRPKDVFYKIKNYQYEVVTISALRKNKFGWLMTNEEGKYKGVLEFVPPDERKAFYHISKQLIQSENREYIYLNPLVKCKVKYQCLSKNGLMRSASFENFVLS